MSIPGAANPLLLASTSTAYTVSRSVRLNSADSAYFSRTPASAGNRRTWTFSCWIKRSALGTFQSLFACIASNASHYTQFIFETGDNFVLYDSLCSGGLAFSTTQVFRDTSAWFHFLLYYDTTQSTASAKAKLYINGAEVTQFNTDNRSGLTADSSINRADQHVIGSRLPYTGGVGAAYFPGYLAEIHFIDGQALTPSSFTEVSATTGQLIPKKYTGTFTGNSFWLQFADNSAATATTLGKDSSGLGNNWTPNNLSVTAGAGNDSLVDTPTSGSQVDTGLGGQVTGNYCTWNPLYGNGTLSNGNLDVSTTTTNATTGTIFASSGKWYWETTVTTSSFNRIGVVNVSGAGQNLGGTANSWAILHDGQIYTNSSTASYGPSYGAGDVISIALDIDAGKIWYGKNGTWMASGNPATGANPSQTFTAGQTMAPAVASGSGTCAYVLNAGARPFAYTAPSGFKALCDTNLPAPVVAKSSTAFDVKLYSGTGATQAVTGLGFGPDLVWIKERNAGSWHQLNDAVRGANKQLYSNDTAAEGTQTDRLQSFDSTGFTLGSSASGGVNNSGSSYAAWCWDAGSSTVTNTQGSITSSVRANASAGFSICTFSVTTANSISTFGTGLNASPEFVIIKPRNTAIDWAVFHNFSGTSPLQARLQLNTTAARYAYGYDVWSRSSTTLGVYSTILAAPGTAIDCVAYCFAPVAGYSSFGSYVGNGSADGVFQWCGFRPRWLLIKSSSGATENWVLIDSARDTYNVAGTYLLPNLANAEGSSLPVDLLSNGFKLRGSGGTNQSAVTYVWAAFAESPFAYSRAR